MKKTRNLILALAAVALVGLCTTTAEAGRRYGRGPVRYGPPVRVAPRYVRPPVVGPVIVRPPAYLYDYGYYRAPIGVPVGPRGYYYNRYYGGPGVHIRVPGFGFDVRY